MQFWLIKMHTLAIVLHISSNEVIFNPLKFYACKFLLAYYNFNGFGKKLLLILTKKVKKAGMAGEISFQ